MKSSEEIERNNEGNEQPASCCCCSPSSGSVPEEPQTIAPEKVDSVLRGEDHIGAWKARWGIGRMGYITKPGLYALGSPTPDSVVLVTANYKMSFDRLRSELPGRDAWILVLDTKGINVWCAAGKGTFGTDEIVHRIEVTGLSEVVSHKKLILPQLGAPGVCSHEVKKRSGFSAIYGPIRAKDLPSFLDAGMKATAEMRRVEFPFYDRLVLVPMELVIAAKFFLFIAAFFLLFSSISKEGLSTTQLVNEGPQQIMLLFLTLIAGAALGPILLPWLPGRSFSMKGAWMGVIAALFAVFIILPDVMNNMFYVAAWMLLIPASASFLTMNFTGASTYTSLSGVKREMRIAVPFQTLCILSGLILFIVSRFR